MKPVQKYAKYETCTGFIFANFSKLFFFNFEINGYFHLFYFIFLWGDGGRLAPVSYVNCFSKTDNLSKIAIYKLYLEVEALGLDITKFDYQRE